MWMALVSGISRRLEYGSPSAPVIFQMVLMVGFAVPFSSCESTTLLTPAISASCPMLSLRSSLILLRLIAMIALISI